MSIVDKYLNDRLDYKRIIDFLNLSEETAASKLKNPRLYREICLVNTEIKRSNIEGIGLFAKKFIKSGNIIDCAIRGYYTTQAGRYINHSVDGNSNIIVKKDYYLVAIKDVLPEEEITIDYRQVFDVCQNLKIGI